MFSEEKLSDTDQKAILNLAKETLSPFEESVGEKEQSKQAEKVALKAKNDEIDNNPKGANPKD